MPGQRGESIRDLQRRLVAAGYLTAVAEPGFFCDDTATSLLAFQRARGLAVDGVCGEYTWAGLVEASWRPGDRLLYLTAPNLRGDDVAALQTHLGVLGFDCGKVDGIFGPLTVAALRNFQADCALLVDGVCGPVTLQLLERVRRQTGTGPGVATMRERARMQAHGGSLRDLRVVIGHFGGMSMLTRALARDVRSHGATVISIDEPDPRAQAEAANQFEADVYVGFQVEPTMHNTPVHGLPLPTVSGHGQVPVSAPTEPRSCIEIAYYSVPTFESTGGRSLAEALAKAWAGYDGLAPSMRGMRLQVLRETRMPAVLITVSQVRRVLDRSLSIAASVRGALDEWTAPPPRG